MSESFIVEYIPQRLKQLSYVKWHIRHRDIVIECGDTVMIPAYNELFFIIDDPDGVLIESDYGLYDATGAPSKEYIHQHRGEILITNPSAGKKRVKFIQVIIVN